MFGRVSDLLRWFKEHFRDPVPGQSTPSTPRGAMTSRTPYTTTPGTVSGEFSYIIIINCQSSEFLYEIPGIKIYILLEKNILFQDKILNYSALTTIYFSFAEIKCNKY